MIFLDFLLNLLLFKLGKRAICVKKALSFVTYSAVPARRLSFVTYSAVPARRLSFAYPSLILRLSIPYLSLIYPLSIPYLSLIYPLSTPYLPLIYPLSIAYPSSHTRLCQLADFPSLILRLRFAHPSLGRILNFEF